MVDHNLSLKIDDNHSHSNRVPYTYADAINIPAGVPDRWYTIAEGVGRGFGRFIVQDYTSGMHNLIEFTVTMSYGVGHIQVQHGTSRGTRSIKGVRLLQDTANNQGGVMKLQVLLSPNPTVATVFRACMYLHDTATGWTGMTLLYTAIWENNPAGKTILANTVVTEPLLNRFVSNNMKVKGSLTATAHPVTSDIRVKENIQVVTDPIEKIQSVTGYTFTRNDLEDTTTRHSGVIAQDLERVLPEAVVTGSDTIKSVSYGSIIPLLVESLKKLDEKASDLVSKLS